MKNVVHRNTPEEVYIAFIDTEKLINSLAENVLVVKSMHIGLQYIWGVIKIIILSRRYSTYSIPCAVCLPISNSCNISNFDSLTWRWRYSVEPSHHCVTIASDGFDIHPINNNTLICLVFLERKITLTNALFYVSYYYRAWLSFGYVTVVRLLRSWKLEVVPAWVLLYLTV